MGYIPTPPPQMIDVTCMDDTERVFVPGPAGHRYMGRHDPWRAAATPCPKPARMAMIGAVLLAALFIALAWSAASVLGAS